MLWVYEKIAGLFQGICELNGEKLGTSKHEVIVYENKGTSKSGTAEIRNNENSEHL